MNLNPPEFLSTTLSDHSNALLGFEINSSEALSYDEWGNPILSSEELSFKAIVHPQEAIATDPSEMLEGVDLRWLRIRGRLTSPKTFGGTVAHLSEGKITFNDGRSGKIKILLPAANPYQNNILGEEFQGFVLLEGF